MNILFTICGRAGSKGFKNKNLKEMNGVPLAYYTLAAISGYSTRHPENSVHIAVNTDSVPLKKLIERQITLPICFIERKEELAGDIVPKVAVIQDTYKQMKNECPDVVIDLDITSPYRRVVDIENIVAEYSEGIYDIVFSVVQARRSPYFNMVEKKEDGFYKKICQSTFTARQQASQSYELNASIYAYKPQFLDGTIDKTILDYKCGISVMPDFLVLDIDSEEDFSMEDFMRGMEQLAENGNGTVTANESSPDYYGDPYYDTDGNATLIKSEQIIYNTEEMQFIAVTTKDGHVFYVLINYSAQNAEDQVFFLNKVDDYDLYALLYAGAEDDDEKKKITPEQAAQAAEKANGRVQSGDGADIADTEENAEDGEDATDSAAQAKPVPMNKNSMMLVFGAIALIGVGGAGFFIMKKKNGGKAAAQAVPDDTEDDEEETMIDEDNEYRFYDGSDDNEDDE